MLDELKALLDRLDDDDDHPVEAIRSLVAILINGLNETEPLVEEMKKRRDEQ